jgi:hypothetical protein
MKADDLVERLRDLARPAEYGRTVEQDLMLEAATAIASLREERDRLKLGASEFAAIRAERDSLRERVRLRNDELEAINASHKELAHRLAESGERVRVLEGRIALCSGSCYCGDIVIEQGTVKPSALPGDLPK